MSRHLPLLTLFSGLIAAGTVAAQQSDRFAYAITDIQAPGGNWSFLRKIDLPTASYSDILLTGNNAGIQAFDAGTRKALTAPAQDPRFGTHANAAFATGVAAAAYDKKSDRLWYTPMFLDQLRYVDLKTMNVYYLTGQGLLGQADKAPDQSNIITRMTLGADGNGYALTNDGNQLIRFSAGKKNIQVQLLGGLVDDPNNKHMSIHNSCSSYGGDMIADDDGNLYVFSARNGVFKVNIDSRVASYVGTISGLPNGFSVNGAAVMEDNRILVSSAMAASSYFTVDLRSLGATAFPVQGTVWQTSDLANSNVYVSGNRPKTTEVEMLARTVPANSGDGKISLFPNPVTQNQFAIRFQDLQPGNYTIQVTDITGRIMIQQLMNLAGENQVQTVRMDAAAARGIYLVKVTDQDNKAVYSSKIMLQ